jgi:hypothetical protein
MIRRTLQSVLCIFLSSQLAAQQAAQSIESQTPTRNAASTTAILAPASPSFVSIPKASEIDLVALDPISSRTAKVGSKIQFRVLRDLAVQNITVVRAGTLLTGTVKEVTVASKKHHRDGQILVRLDNYRIGTGQALRLTGMSPEERLERKHVQTQKRKEIIEILLLPPLWVPFIRLAIGWRNEGGHPSGNDVELSSCFHVGAYTVSPIKIRSSALLDAKGDPEEPSSKVCPSSWETSLLRVE